MEGNVFGHSEDLGLLEPWNHTVHFAGSKRAGEDLAGRSNDRIGVMYRARNNHEGVSISWFECCISSTVSKTCLDQCGW